MPHLREPSMARGNRHAPNVTVSAVRPSAAIRPAIAAAVGPAIVAAILIALGQVTAGHASVEALPKARAFILRFCRIERGAASENRDSDQGA